MRRATDLDARIGITIRKVRQEKGLTQSDVADLLGVSFQQIQKYEGGTNRICASRLYLLAKALGLDINFFFEEF